MINVKFNVRYFLLTVALFIAEVLIATKLKDIFFVRAYLGDVIVVILLYTFIKSFFIIPSNQKLIAGIFIFSCLIEFAQYFNIAEKLGFQRGSLMYIVIGNSFSWIDILCYGAGCVLMFLLLKVKSKK
jgi:restriction endonuclease S subunit